MIFVLYRLGSPIGRMLAQNRGVVYYLVAPVSHIHESHVKASCGHNGAPATPGG